MSMSEINFQAVLPMLSRIHTSNKCHCSYTEAHTHSHTQLRVKLLILDQDTFEVEIANANALKFHCNVFFACHFPPLFLTTAVPLLIPK